MSAAIRQQQKDGTWLEQKDFGFISRSESSPGTEKEKSAPDKSRLKIAADNDAAVISYRCPTGQKKVNSGGVLCRG